VHPGDLAGGYSDLEMTWLLYCAGAATAVWLVFSLICRVFNGVGKRHDVNLLAEWQRFEQGYWTTPTG